MRVWAWFRDSATTLHNADMCRTVCQRQLIFLLLICIQLSRQIKTQNNVSLHNVDDMRHIP